MILRGNLSPDGAVRQSRRTRAACCTPGRARVFEREEDAMHAVDAARDRRRRRRRHPLRGSEGRSRACARCSASPRRSSAKGSARPSRSITDGRFSGATRGLMIGHVAPEAFVGGPIAAVRDGDTISDRHRRPRELDLEIAAGGDRAAVGRAGKQPAAALREQQRDGEVRASRRFGVRRRGHDRVNLVCSECGRPAADDAMFCASCDGLARRSRRSPLRPGADLDRDRIAARRNSHDPRDRSGRVALSRTVAADSAAKRSSRCAKATSRSTMRRAAPSTPGCGDSRTCTSG